MEGSSLHAHIKQPNGCVCIRIRGQSLHESDLLHLLVSPVASAPFSYELNRDALFKAKGDISAGEIKFVKDEILVRAELHLLVNEDEAEEVYNLSEDDSVEIGPFVVSYTAACALLAFNMLSRLLY